MAFDQTTRNRLQRFVTDARDTLSLEFTRQLQNEYGMDPKDGTVTPLENLRHLDDASRETARLLRDTLDHYMAASPSADRREALDRIVREQAFTVLNRLAALRMAEARGILTESVSKVYDSKGFQLYLMLAGTGHGETGDAYRSFLFSIFDEFALDLNVLFDRFSPQGRLFPREAALLELLGLMNDPEVAPLWGEDETIGWIYQYFNSKEERKKMRDESVSPRNSRELAVRNQFFTPRYVVEFLTDNTLGRIWYEMTRGETRLKDQCRYLVRRPTEIFLGDPREAARRFNFKYVAEHVPPSVRAAYRGDFAAATTEGITMNRWWIALAIPPDQFEKVTGLPLDQLHDYPHLERIWEALDKEPNSPLLKDPASVLSAFSEFVLTSSGGPYAVEPTERLWEAFKAAVAQQSEENLSQEELLGRPVFIPHRPLKDPRSLRVLDPACGSMHFGLYAYDLLEVIYEEAWELEEKWAAEEFEREAGLLPLHETFADKKGFIREVPRLIIEHNLHGIDIDPRAVQIAGLSLWLRAQRAWAGQGVKPSDRPQIMRSNIVCAEPMPGEESLLKEFVDKNLSATPELHLLGQLVRHVFNAMKLAGEAGSLLKIETEIANAVAEAKTKWLEVPTPKQDLLFAEMAKPEQQQFGYEVAGITDEAFWERAEQLIYEALQTYAEKSENGGGYQRRLFADDTARGFAFIDLCRQRYDVVLMNPPFGEATLSSREQLYETLPEAARDLFAGFVTRFNAILAERGRLGVLSNRTAFFSEFLETWRVVNFLGENARLNIVGDLGYGVLDAVVEAAAYVCTKDENQNSQFINALNATDKPKMLSLHVSAIRTGQALDGYFIRTLAVFKELPHHRILYQFPPYWVSKINHKEIHNILDSRGGLATGDNERNLRLFWELTPSQIGGRWKWFAKGGEFSRYRTNLHLLIDEQNRDHLRRLGPVELFGKRGITYTERTTSNISARVLNEGAWFSAAGPAVFPTKQEYLHFLLAYMNSFVVTYFVEAIVGGGDFSMKGTAARHLEPGYMRYLPEVKISTDDASWFTNNVEQLLRLLDMFVDEEVDALFDSLFVERDKSLASSLQTINRRRFGIFETAYGIIALLEKKITDLLQIPEGRVRDAYSDSGWPWNSGETFSNLSHTGLISLDPMTPEQVPAELASITGNYRFEMKLSHYLHAGVERYASALKVAPYVICNFLRDNSIPGEDALFNYCIRVVSYILGSVFGRWDVRFATDNKLQLEILDQFGPLPMCSRGMLQNAEGLPAKPNDVPKNYPLRISWLGILVDDPGHAEDIEARAREVLYVIWPKRADAIEHEGCEILGVDSLREYFRKPNNFFADHLSRYSKSRRQAPIYWPLSTPSGSYTLWLYYHRLDAQTLYRSVVDFVEPKLRQTNDALGQLRAKANRARDEERELERLQDFALELQAFRDELLRLAQLPWRPDLNDGVQITAAPLWKLFRLPKWQKTLKETWQKLEKGEYDWAHLAMTIWPERVVPKCVKDRSLAIAHGLEDLFWVEDADGWRKLRRPEQEIEEQKKRQRSDARARVALLLAKFAASEEGDLSADEVRSRLSGEEWNDREAALLLYPERVADACWENPNVARRLSIQLPAKRSAAARQQFTKKLVKSGCPDIADKLESALRDRTEPFCALWEEMERGDRDDLEVAVAFWPERVIDKCSEDVHLAERHGVRQFLWCRHPSDEWRRREDPDTEVDNEVARRRGAGRREGVNA